MRNKDLLNLLNDVQEEGNDTVESKRVLVIDGLNLFFRNFAMLNMVNPEGVHIGGLGGFFRSLGALIRQTDPTEVIVVFDGVGSSANRKNLVPEYKSNRNLQRITNWDTFDDMDEEQDSKIDQIVRIIQYLKTLPVKTIAIDKTEADDIIAYLGSIIPEKPEDKIIIVSSDKDFLQLVNENVLVYRPIEKEYYNEDTIKEKFNISPHNFIIYKTLLGDSSDKVKGIKGLGEKGLYKKFPEITEKDLTLDDIHSICESKFKDHLVYARVIQNIEELEKNYKIMDLSNPMLTDRDKEQLKTFVLSEKTHYLPEQFLAMYKKDQLGSIIRNVEYWIGDVFSRFEQK
jgi:DNA polymerase-1|tara:strand:+ start:3919 stop:4947 length:1029 start_codon:yes stop_codon:yes gene_type:complete